MYIYGIDPGFTGAIAVIDTLTGDLDVRDMPTMPGKKGKVILNMVGLYDLLTPPQNQPCMAVLEQVATMPRQGISSAFRFGQGYGALQMALTANRLKTHDITPPVWKKHFKLSKDKGVSRGLAMQRFPQHATFFQRVKDDGRAEAVLLALYGQEVLLP